jgi:hypothetical protein
LWDPILIYSSNLNYKYLPNCPITHAKFGFIPDIIYKLTNIHHTTYSYNQLQRLHIRTLRLAYTISYRPDYISASVAIPKHFQSTCKVHMHPNVGLGKYMLRTPLEHLHQVAHPSLKEEHMGSQNMRLKITITGLALH